MSEGLGDIRETKKVEVDAGQGVNPGPVNRSIYAVIATVTIDASICHPFGSAQGFMHEQRAMHGPVDRGSQVLKRSKHHAGYAS
jgi:hypothetical protein